MTTQKKSSPEEIRERFDQDVERFSNLEDGQTSVPDSARMMDLVARAAAVLNPDAENALDVGCGAGNGSLKLLEKIPGLDFTLIDLSQPMLQKAEERLGDAGAGGVATLQGDLRSVPIADDQYDVVIASAVLHHLRSEEEWKAVLDKLYQAMKPGGSLWIIDLVLHDQPEINQVAWDLYGDYLQDLKGEAYREDVFAYIEKEDSPLPLNLQLRYLRDAGFTTEVLHKQMCFAAFGGIKTW